MPSCPVADTAITCVTAVHGDAHVAILRWRCCCLLLRWYMGLGEVTELPEAMVLRQLWFGRERGPVDEAAQREAGAVEPLALPEAGHIEQLRVGLGQPGHHRRPARPGREGRQGHLDV